MSRVLVVGDIHAPVTHPGYLAFCQELYAQEKCNEVVLIGDVVDWHAISFHERHPSCPGPKDEYERALSEVARWYDAFPQATVTVGNHDSRIGRVAESAGIPPEFIRSYQDLWKTPKWAWVWDYNKDGVFYFHGTGFGGQHPAYNAMRTMLMSVVMGHTHTVGGVDWLANPHRRIFGLDVGCGIDDEAAAFAYGRHLKKRSMLGAGVVLEGAEAYFVPMPMGRGEAYHRSNFESPQGKKKG